MKRSSLSETGLAPLGVSGVRVTAQFPARWCAYFCAPITISDDQNRPASAEKWRDLVMCPCRWSLYSSDLGLPYRLKGWHAVDAETRQIAERCSLFLRSEFEYAWPETPKPDLQHLAFGFAVPLSLLFGIALTIVALLGLKAPSLSQSLYIAILAAIVLGIGLHLHWWHIRRASARMEAFYSVGCREAWPFLGLEEYRRTLANVDAGRAATTEAGQTIDR
jgi:hypothetical protein